MLRRTQVGDMIEPKSKKQARTGPIRRPWLNPDGGRELTVEDLERMRLPYRCWDTSAKFFQASPEGMDVLKKYAKTMRYQREEGVGLFLQGNNGVGKTCIAAHYLKVFRSHGMSCMYVNCAELIESSRKSNPVMGGDYDMWTFAKVCDVLLIDDLGKEHRPNSGYGAGYPEKKLEELLRARHDRCGVTLITTNMMSDEFQKAYKKTTRSIIQATTVRILIKGEDLRMKNSNKHMEHMDMLAGDKDGFRQI